MADQGEEKKSSGCGLLVLYYTIFRRQPSSTAPAPRRSSSTSSIPNTNTNTNAHAHADLSPSNSKRRRAGSDEVTLLSHVKPPDLPTVPPKSALNKMLTPHATATCYQKPIVRKQPPSNELSVKTVPGPGPLKRLQSNGLTAELESMIHDHQRTKGSSTLVRASSGNVMLYGNLGNIRAPGAVTTNHHLSKAAATAAAETRENANNDNAVSNSSSSTAIEPVMSMCRALSRRLDPEELKEMGNDEYSKGRYPEAIALYDRAISISPQVASYHSNKAAALMRHGLLLDAVAECTEAVRLDPCYSRAHHRLATLHLRYHQSTIWFQSPFVHWTLHHMALHSPRLGEAEKAIRYYKLAKGETKANDISQGQALQSHLNKCNEAHRLKDWHTVLKEAEAAVNSGADAAPQVSFVYLTSSLLLFIRHKQRRD